MVVCNTWSAYQNTYLSYQHSEPSGLSWFSSEANIKVLAVLSQETLQNIYF